MCALRRHHSVVLALLLERDDIEDKDERSVSWLRRSRVMSTKMNTNAFRSFGGAYNNTDQVPKDLNLYYHCKTCGDIIRSVPEDNIGCACGNIFIDKDCWRLVVEDFAAFEVVAKLTK